LSSSKLPLFIGVLIALWRCCCWSCSAPFMIPLQAAFMNLL